MDEVIEIVGDSVDVSARCDRGVELAARDQRVRHSPDAVLVALRRGSLVARCSCWWRQTPLLDAHPVGMVGHYAAADRVAASSVLERACTLFAANKCHQAVGPIDGSTWRQYRFAGEGSLPAPFFLEPSNPRDWPADWAASGFSPLATYASAITDDFTADHQRTGEARDGLRNLGITVRPFDIVRPDAELQAIFHLLLASFERNFLYAPIAEEEFLHDGRTLLPFVRPELTFLAERDGQLVAFLMALPDVLQAQRGRPVDTVIVKTVAVAPILHGSGVGSALVTLAHDRAQSLGFRRAIHALMHDSNPSLRISRRSARVFRRYALLARPTTASHCRGGVQ
jgi:GNAT superfamily N-acetyltransferase